MLGENESVNLIEFRWLYRAVFFRQDSLEIFVTKPFFVVVVCL